MAKFKTMTEWLKTNPSQEEQEKILNVINRGEFREIRKKVWEGEKYLRKLSSMVKSFENLNMKPPKDILEKANQIQSEIESLKKDLPPVKPRVKKVADSTENL